MQLAMAQRESLTYHVESIAEPLRTGGKGSELGLRDMASQLAGGPWEGGEEFGSHCRRREEGGMRGVRLG
jgi:hypothetical protein